ncbi:MAG: glycosyltransferase [Prevotellaceae bacterium]|jgi:glycosyltransferase involved in cell wall biosynthesis|nr:glycosyltransferase [Prevotellaceae bacterium]
MNILYIITGLELGGAEIITVDLAAKMVGLGHKVSLVYLTGENRMRQRIHPEMPVVALAMHKNPVSLVKCIFRARQVIRQFSPDIVHANMVHANLFARLLRIFVKIPKLICSAHSKNEGGQLRLWLYRLTDGMSDLNTNVSQEAVDYFVKQKAFSAQKSMPVYNGISLSRFRKDGELRHRRRACAIADDDFLFIAVGRLTAAKDYPTLIEAFHLVHKKHPQTKLIVIGKGELQTAIEQRIAAKHLNNHILLWGVRTDVETCYNMADCFVLSSAWEGFGIVLAEAMACELPVITTDAGGCAEVVGQPEWVVPVKNSALLAQKMSETVELSIRERNLIGINNRHLAQRFDINTIVEQWENLYQRLDSNS